MLVRSSEAADVLTLPDYLDAPAAGQLDFDAVDSLTMFHQITAGQVDPEAAGLIEPAPSLADGLEAVTFTQSRVAGWNDGVVAEGDLVKLKTMSDLTAPGQAMIDHVRSLAPDMPTKELAAWRVSRPLMRRLSLDELPQLIVNVGGQLRNTFRGAMDMDLVGGGRPPLRDEITYRGDNANDHYGRALHAEAAAHKLSPDAMHQALGRMFVPGLITPATAEGHRQLNDEDGFRSWIQGIVRYDELDHLPALSRTRAMGGLVIATARHVARRTDAA